MKKILCSLLLVGLVFSLTACGEKKDDNTNTGETTLEKDFRKTAENYYASVKSTYKSSVPINMTVKLWELEDAGVDISKYSTCDKEKTFVLYAITFDENNLAKDTAGITLTMDCK